MDSYESIIQALEGGADRLELCSCLDVGGLTPTKELVGLAVQAVKEENFDVKLYAMVRPRPGDFVYSQKDIDQIEKDINWLVQGHGTRVEGVVFGFASEHKQVDLENTRRFCEIVRSHGLDVTFHRAFDEMWDLDTALEDIIACGIGRVLTSGGKETADKGAIAISALVEKFGDRISIMAGAGVHSANVKRVLEITKCYEIHGSFKRSGTWTDKDEVSAVRKVLCQYHTQDIL